MSVGTVAALCLCGYKDHVTPHQSGGKRSVTLANI